MLKFAVTAQSLSDDIRTAASIAQASGFVGLTVPARAPGVDLTQLSQSGAREYLHILSSFGQQLVAIEHRLDKNGISPTADIDRVLDDAAKLIRAAGELGRVMICLDVGALPPAATAAKPKPTVSPLQAGLIIIPEMPSVPAEASTPAEPRDEKFEAAADTALREIGARADRHGIIIALRASLANFAALERAIAASRCPWLGVELDTQSILADDWSMDEVFSRLAPLLRHVRAKDGLRGSARRVQSTGLGDGQVDWPMLLANLDASSYGGFVTIDTTDLTDRRTAAVSGLSFLKSNAAVR